ncbi:MAG TPA: TIGR00266 family protein [Candidatus Acidoferrum sp.]|nr:TIGR00266 family protein [Candidatus Acidoferrum sp.]
MFCTKCGSKLPDGTLFCSNCGAQLGGAPGGQMPQKPADEIDYKLFGDDMQLVEIELDPGESVLAEAGAMTYIEQDIKMETIFGDGSGQDAGKDLWGKLASAGKRALAGESLFMTVFTNIGAGKSHAAFAAPYPGKILPVELREFDGTLICQKNAFLCAAKGVAISISFNKRIGAGFFGGEGFIMQKLMGDGLIFLHAGGTIVKKELAAGEVLRIDTGCLVAMSASVDYDVQFASDLKSGLFGGEGIFIATLKGPGHVWLQSLPISRMADRINQARFDRSGENRGLNNPIGEVTSGLGNALGGLLKF